MYGYAYTRGPGNHTMTLATREAGLEPGKQLRGHRQPKEGSEVEMADVLRVMEHVCRQLDSGETWLPDHTVAWCRVNLRATAQYAMRLGRLVQEQLVAVMAESAAALRARLVRSAEAERVAAHNDGQYAAAVSALKAQGDWLLPKQQPTGDQHVHLHFAAELDAVEQRMRAARAIAAGFPAIPAPTDGNGVPLSATQDLPESAKWHLPSMVGHQDQDVSLSPPLSPPVPAAPLGPASP